MVWRVPHASCDVIAAGRRFNRWVGRVVKEREILLFHAFAGAEPPAGIKRIATRVLRPVANVDISGRRHARHAG